MLFAAHDPGGALMLGATVTKARERGHEVMFFGAGPALQLWYEAGFNVIPAETVFDLDGFLTRLPDLVVTGTGFGSFECACWEWAREKRKPSMAMIDAWANLAVRFQSKTGFVYPDRIGVIDEVARESLFEEVTGRVAVEVVGQPHLQAQVLNLRGFRADRPPSTGGINFVFFSEPVAEDFGRDVRGFDQFEVFEALVSNLPVSQSLILWVKPHPREGCKRWNEIVVSHRKKRNIEVKLAHQSTNEVLSMADAVIGMTSMVLVEAHLLGIPVLSLQLNRKNLGNPIIEDVCEVVTELEVLAGIVSRFQSEIDNEVFINPKISAVLNNADQRVIFALERLLHAD